MKCKATRQIEQFNRSRGKRVDRDRDLRTGVGTKLKFKERGNLLFVSRVTGRFSYLQQKEEGINTLKLGDGLEFSYRKTEGEKGVSVRVQRLKQFNEKDKPFQHLTFLGIQRV